jgi:DMSO reductase anchor subunit
MLLALRRIDRSPLSVELLLAGITFAAALATFLRYRTVPFFAWRVTIVAALILLLVMGFVYRLGGQLSWKRAAVVAPLIIGMLWGSVFLLVVENAASATSLPLVYLLITIDVLVTTIRWRTIEHSGRYGQPRFAAAFEDRQKLIITRLIVTDLLTMTALLLIDPVVALITVTAGVFMDRYIFYALGVEHTTEAEISRVESFISDL